MLNYEACFVVVLKDPTANLTLNKIRLDMSQIVLLIATYELLTILFQGLKKKGPSCHLGQVHFPVGQVKFTTESN